MGNKSENKKAEQKAEQKVEQKVEQKAEKKAEQKAEKVEKKTSKKETKTVQEPAPVQEQVCDKFEEQLTSTQEECGKLKELLKSVSDSLKKLQATHKSEVKKMKTKKSKRSENHKPTGFARLRPVSGKLAGFIGVESGTELSGPQITAKVWAELKNRNLTYQGDEKKGVKGDQRVLRVDDEVSKLFGVSMSVNKSVDCKDPNGFNFGNLQKYIKNAMAEAPAQVSSEASKDVKDSKKKEKTLVK
jgi:chromatin remodeling complex protein RSC6